MKTYSRKKSGDNSDVIINLNELCRLCLSKEEELIPIFSEDEPIPLTLRIMACVSLEVFDGDGLPNMICHACKYQLEKSYTFKKKCESSDLKLRRHLKLIQEKIITPPKDERNDPAEQHEENGDKQQQTQDVTELLADFISVEPAETETNDSEEPSTEQDLVGARVAYLHQDNDQQEEPDSDSITLPMETEDNTKDACTLKTMNLKKEIIEEEDPTEEESNPNLFLMADDEQPEPYDDSLCIIEQNDFSAIADAVKQTLASQPGLNLSGELQIKLDSKPGQPTQVQVTTEDGSVVIMELMTEEDQPEPPQMYEMEDVDENGELKVFQCPDCPKAFSRRIQLRRHSSVHMQQRGFSCGICEKWFPTRSALIRHARIHTGERPFQCEVCQKSFAQKEILFRHLMTHTGKKPYNCPHCPKGFTQKEPLRVHMRTHSTPNPNDIQLHRCTLCPKVFCHASGLSRHLLTHTGKTFKCRDCDKAFTDKSSLRRHHKLVNHHP